MCGIAGRYNFLSGVPVRPEILEKMCDLLGHRGPDGHGIYHEGSVGFGHSRLAVIDLTEAAHQPMVSDDGRCWITYNGEIYNFRELRKTLESCGHQFRSSSDTEVVLAAYREYGIKCLHHFRGMFAFAIWDAREKMLFLVRDRVGKKPLYYWVDREGIAFASEPKAFLSDPSFRSEVNLEAISHYLTYQYVPAPWSAFRGVHKLQPAHYLVVKNGKISAERYWKLSYANTFQGSKKDACVELLDKLKKAVEIRLISDVPLGAFLSGGIDSSVTVALMAQLGVSPLKTFSIGFEQPEYNELPYARSVAQQYGTEHHEFIVTPRASDLFPKLVWHYNEPFADSSAIPTFYLAEMTRNHVTVALNGDGGDEDLAGYDRYVANALSGWYEYLPRSMRSLLRRASQWLPGPYQPKSFLSRAQHFLGVLDQDPKHRYAHWVSHFYPSLKEKVCTPEFLDEAKGRDSLGLIVKAYSRSDASDFIDATLDVDVNTYLPDDLLVKVDIATMAYGLEARSPFLDHEVMEFCASLPSWMKLRGLEKKHILKLCIRDLLPRDIIKRPKMGFGVPIDHWFRKELKDFTYDQLLSSRAIQRGYFQRKAVQQLLDEHVNHIRAWPYQLWNLLMLELWHRMFIDGDSGLVARNTRLN
jgi:asparagine synthase (glutamine-hydrolysing)